MKANSRDLYTTTEELPTIFSTLVLRRTKATKKKYVGLAETTMCSIDDRDYEGIANVWTKETFHP